MHRSIILVSSSLSSDLKELIDRSNLTHHLLSVVVCLSILENILCIEQLLINVTWSQVSNAHYENFSRNETRSLGFGDFHFLEKFVEDPNERIEVCRSENFGDKVSPLSQKRAGQLQS